MENVVLLLGSNQGDREQLLIKAANLLEQQIGHIESRTQIIPTPPFGFNSQNEFLNQALVINTTLSPTQILEINQQIETTLGRKRTPEPHNTNGERTYQDRPIDIDILYYGSQIINTPNLTIPHPRIHERPFVMEIIRDVRW